MSETGLTSREGKQTAATKRADLASNTCTVREMDEQNFIDEETCGKTAHDSTKDIARLPFDWKPFAMRDPYLLLLIIISVGLASLEEWLCEHSISLSRNARGLLELNSPAEVPWTFYFFY